MMKTIAVLMSSQTLKQPNVFHHPVNFNIYIYIFILSIKYHISTLIFMLFDIKSEVNVIFEQPKRHVFAHNVMAIRDQRHVNKSKSKQTTALAGFDVAPPGHMRGP